MASQYSQFDATPQIVVPGGDGGYHHNYQHQQQQQQYQEATEVLHTIEVGHLVLDADGNCLDVSWNL